MDFGKALEALKDEKKVKRPTMISDSYITLDGEPPYQADYLTVATLGGSCYMSRAQYIPTLDDMMATDWEIIEEIPEAKPEDWKVIPKYKEWLDKNIRESCGCVESGHVYYVQCMEKLNELLYKQQTIWRGEKCERLTVSLPPKYGNSEIVSRRIPAYKPT